jgi:murein DD-endopeptidase MepM/ murein hydrolase activator NlpD/SH3-like domain-containing protein
MNIDTRSHFHFSIWTFFHFAILFSLGTSFSCQKAADFFRPPPPELTAWETYNAALDSMGLADSQLAQSWRAAAEQAVQDSLFIDSPLREMAYFKAEQPMANGYRVDLKRGELLNINLRSYPDSTLIFLDLFIEETIDSITSLRPVFHANEYQTDSLEYEIDLNGTYILRVQPELLATGRYTLELIVQPAYSFFPVSGKGNPDVWSFFGDPREGGRRTHKGIDIFARRGTPVVACTDGYIRSVRDTSLGGRQVWLQDTLRNQSLYYAHLHTQLVEEGVWVKAGDTLGTVGNTGNARSTSPHLHFSIYKRGFGAIDPHPFVARQSDQPSNYLGDTTLLGQLMRVRDGNAVLRIGPGSRFERVGPIDRHLPVEVIGATKGWYRVLRPDGQQGYLYGSSLESIERPLEQLVLDQSSELLQSAASSASPIAQVQKNEQVNVLGKNGKFQLVESEAGRGWLQMPTK